MTEFDPAPHATSDDRPADLRAGAFQGVREARRNELAEDYVELIAELIHDQGEARPVDIAARLGVKVPTVSKTLDTVYTMRDELATIWKRSTASKEQLVRQLEDWCRRAEESGIAALRDFSVKLRAVRQAA